MRKNRYNIIHLFIILSFAWFIANIIFREVGHRAYHSRVEFGQVAAKANVLGELLLEFYRENGYTLPEEKGREFLDEVARSHSQFGREGFGDVFDTESRSQVAGRGFN